PRRVGTPVLDGQGTTRAQVVADLVALGQGTQLRRGRRDDGIVALLDPRSWCGATTPRAQQAWPTANTPPRDAPRHCSRLSCRRSYGRRGRGRPRRASGALAARAVAAWMSSKLGHPVRVQRGWDYLQRLKQSQQLPRPQHAQADPKQQET